MRALFSLFLALFAICASALSASGSRLLVVLDDVSEKDAYRKFFAGLEGRGYQITYETPKSESLTLFHLGERTYDHAIFFPTKVKGLGPNLTPNILIDFLNARGNIMISQSSSTALPSSLVSLLAELEISLPAERTGLVVDHFAYDVASAAESHDVLLLSPPAPVRPGVKPYFQPEAPGNEVIAYPHGSGHILGGGALITPILRAGRTAYIYNPKEQQNTIDPDELFAAGSQIGLVTAFQARNSGRLTVVGAAEMLSDEWFSATVKTTEGKTVPTWNEEFSKRVTGWTFHEIGVLRVNSIKHHLHEEGGKIIPNPTIYRVNNEATYTVSLSEYSWDRWVPFVPAKDDELQLEFSMLSPFQRLNLAPISVEGHEATYSVTFKLPDQHGIFNFMLNYKRPFLTNVEEKRTVSVRHMAHDEWTRSWAISGAWPWISGIGVTVSGFLAFCAVWMYSQPAKTASKAKKTQ
jgi:oligosaccharyltransferase complex subunit beta